MEVQPQATRPVMRSTQSTTADGSASTHRSSLGNLGGPREGAVLASEGENVAPVAVGDEQGGEGVPAARSGGGSEGGEEGARDGGDVHVLGRGVAGVVGCEGREGGLGHHAGALGEMLGSGWPVLWERVRYTGLGRHGSQDAAQRRPPRTGAPAASRRLERRRCRVPGNWPAGSDLSDHSAKSVSSAKGPGRLCCSACAKADGGWPADS